MNRYGQQAHDDYRNHRPKDLAGMADPVSHFTRIGEQVQTAITELRDQILGPPNPDETLEDFRHRSYRTLRQAEEIVSAELLSIPDTQNLSVSSTSMSGRHDGLRILNEALSLLDHDWNETPAATP